MTTSFNQIQIGQKLVFENTYLFYIDSVYWIWISPINTEPHNAFNIAGSNCDFESCPASTPALDSSHIL